MQKAAGMIAARPAQEQMRNFAYRFAHRNANAAELLGSIAQLAINAD